MPPDPPRGMEPSTLLHVGLRPNIICTPTLKKLSESPKPPPPLPHKKQTGLEQYSKQKYW